MTRPRIEPKSPGALANTLTILPMSDRKYIPIYIYIYICITVKFRINFNRIMNGRQQKWTFISQKQSLDITKEKYTSLLFYLFWIFWMGYVLDFITQVSLFHLFIYFYFLSVFYSLMWMLIWWKQESYFRKLSINWWE